MESWIGSRINSPHVVKVVRPRRPKTCLYYLTEYVSGVTLTRWMRENPRPAVGEAVMLIDQIAPGLATELDIFDNEVALRQQGKLDEKVFAETRLRRGAYGQRYDNGQRHDGREARKLEYPAGELTKGPTTLWDAPGMQRVKVPFGGLNATQLEVMADLAEEYSDGIAHVIAGAIDTTSAQ